MKTKNNKTLLDLARNIIRENHSNSNTFYYRDGFYKTTRRQDRILISRFENKKWKQVEAMKEIKFKPHSAWYRRKK